MSRWLARADALAARIDAALNPAAVPPADPMPDALRIPVLVDRQKDIETEIDNALSNLRGVCVVILWTGGRNQSPAHAKLRLGGSYSITVRGLPVLLEDGTTVDDVCETVAETVHGWDPDEARPPAIHRWEVVSVDLVPSRSQLIYEIEARLEQV